MPSQSDGDALYTYMEGIFMSRRWLMYGLCMVSEWGMEGISMTYILLQKRKDMAARAAFMVNLLINNVLRAAMFL